MSSIEMYRGSGVGGGISRRMDREFARIGEAGGIRQARVQTEAEVMATKVEAVGYIGTRAMQTAALVSQMEQQLAQTVPMASGRLASIADATALAMSGMVSDGACNLRRI